MRCFEVWINGQQIYTAGVRDSGRLIGQLLSWPCSSDASSPSGVSGDRLDLNFFGTDTNGDSVFWPMQGLHVGDEVIIRVVDSDVADEPVRRHPRDDAEFERTRRSMYERLRQKYEPDSPTTGPPQSSVETGGG